MEVYTDGRDFKNLIIGTVVMTLGARSLIRGGFSFWSKYMDQKVTIENLTKELEALNVHHED